MNMYGMPDAVLTASTPRVERGQEEGIYRTIAKWAVLVFAFLLPLFVLPVTSAMIEANKFVFLIVVASVALIAWFLGIVVSGTLRVRVSPILTILAAFIGAGILATALSVSPEKSLFGNGIVFAGSLTSIIALSAIACVALHVFDDRGRVLAKTLGAGTLLALVIGLLQLLEIYILGVDAFGSRAFNTVGSVNALGMLAAFSLPLFAKLRLPLPRLKKANVALVGVVVSLAILVILNWWVFWVVTIAGMIGLIIWDSVASLRMGERKFRMAHFLLPMTVIVLGVFLLIVHFSVPTVRNALPVEVAPSFGLSWDVMIKTFGKNLISGFGQENFLLAFDRFGAQRLAQTTLGDIRFLSGTSEAMTMVVEQGAVGILALGTMLWMFGLALVRMARRVQSDEAVHGAVFSMAVAMLVGFFLFSFEGTLMGVFFLLLALVALAAAADHEELIHIEERPAWSLAASLGFITVLISVLTGGYFVASAYTGDVQFAKALRVTDNAQASESMARALAWAPDTDRYLRAIAQRQVAIIGTEINAPAGSQDAERQARIQTAVNNAIGAARRATEADSSDSLNWFTLATTYQQLLGVLENADGLAEDAYKKTADLRPGDPTFSNQLGTMYLAKADLSRQLARNAGANASRFNAEAEASLIKAEEHFKKAIEMSSNFGQAIYNLGAVYDRQGKVKDAIRELERIVPANANNANMLFELGLLYYRDDRKTDAVAAFERAVLISPDFSNARWYLALILEEQKKLPEAIEQVQRILSLEANKDNETIQEKLVQLEQGLATIGPDGALDEKPL
ncbi:MAG: tetratricopeptide repeat protein [Patescibacteria group bacterium]